jgi:hypothetical protein
MLERLIEVADLPLNVPGDSAAGCLALSAGFREKLVRAILAELMEPDRWSIQAGETAVQDGVDECQDSYISWTTVDETKVANAVWRAMISAVLEGRA